MKKLYLLLCIATTAFFANAQIINIPDANFKAKLLAASSTANIAYNQSGGRMKIDINNDGNIQQSEALLVYRLTVPNSSIADLTGIQSFTNLKDLNCYTNQLTSLNLASLVNLETLSCYGNQLTSLDLSTNSLLKTVNCSDNLIASTNISNSFALTEFDCRGNQLTTLNIPNRTSLEYLDCGYNLLTSLNITNDIALTSLDFDSNQLSSIDLTPFVNLIHLGMSSNPYTSVVNLGTLVNLTDLFAESITNPGMCPLTDAAMPNLVSLETLKTDNSTFGNINYNLIPNLHLLLCRNTGLTHINNISPNIPQLVIEKNQITSLDFTAFTHLEALNAYNNPLTSLVWGNHPDLFFLTIGRTQLTTIDVSGFPALNNFAVTNSALLTSCNVKNGLLTNFGFQNCPNLLYICADDIAINNIQTQITDNVLTANGNPSCHVNTYCTMDPGGTFYTIQGNHRWDTTNNGCDSSDFLFPHMKINISNGTITNTLISANDGSYHYDVPAGTYTLTPVFENPSYFTTTSSNTGNIVFPTAASPFTRDYCVRPNGIHNDLEITIIPVNNARPGFDADYKIIYKNKGNTSQSGTINLAFADDVLNFVSALPSLDSQATNSLGWNFSNLLPFETRIISVRVHANSPTDVPSLTAGDLLHYTVSISGLTDENLADNTSVLNQTLRNSYDPNDKTCIEGTTVTPDMAGKYVHYVIRFENTGTANAENVRITDIIDTAKFDISSLIPQTGSHSFTTKINNTNRVEFLFENINLPFDDANNDGYVAFKIKTKPTLVLGDTFANSADIYFDYNTPIITNTYTTTIAALSNQDFEFSSVFSISPVPAKDVLTITTKQDVMMSSVNIYNLLGQLVQVIANPNQTINISELKTGTYFIKIISDKGTASSKFIKE